MSERRSCNPVDKGSNPFVASNTHSDTDAGIEQGRLSGLISHVRQVRLLLPQPGNDREKGKRKEKRATGKEVILIFVTLSSMAARFTISPLSPSSFFCGVAKLVRHRTVNAAMRRFESFRHSQIIGDFQLPIADLGVGL